MAQEISSAIFESESNQIAPKVSVCIVTYNQEKYIRQCLESVLNQDIDFDIEIVIADDLSTDQTRKIISEFKNRYPTIIKTHFHQANIGPYKNFVFVHQQALGEYIAHIDGDDYCLPGKLKIQASILDNEPQCNIVWHKMAIEDDQGKISQSEKITFRNKKFFRKDIIQYISIGANSSKMYRKCVRDFELPNFDVVDYFANVEQVGSGYARLMDEKCYGVYRAGIGISSSGSATRIILGKCFLYFYKKYPEYALNVSLANLTYCLSDLKNRRPTWLMFFLIWIKNIKLASLLHFSSHLKFSRSLGKK